MGRDTRTGAVLESMILPALERGGYNYSKQINIGARGSGGRHYVDVIAEKAGVRFLISLKWQQVAGTAEQKVPFEVISLLEAVAANKKRYKKAYVVLGGQGWSLRDYYTTGGLEKHLAHAEKVDILTLENFVAVANKGQL